MVLTAPGGKVPKDLSWNAGKKLMGNVDAFLKSLIAFDKVRAAAAVSAAAGRLAGAVRGGTRCRLPLAPSAPSADHGRTVTVTHPHSIRLHQPPTPPPPAPRGPCRTTCPSTAPTWWSATT